MEKGRSENIDASSYNVRIQRQRRFRNHNGDVDATLIFTEMKN